LHRDLLLGEPGRLYSELAASWLGVMAVSGIVLVVLHRRRVGRGRRARVTLVPRPGEANAYRRTRSCHPATGVWLALDFLFLAASGLTWSAHAGENVSQLRSAPPWAWPLLLVVGLGAGLFVPLLGISLAALLAADLAVAVVAQRRSPRESAH